MKQQNYRHLLYFIATTIVITIAIQVYWNVQNYNTSKQNLINEVQISLDNGVEIYYADLAKTDLFSFIGIQHIDDSVSVNTKMIGFLDKMDAEGIGRKIDSSIKHGSYKGKSIGYTQIIDSTSAFTFMKPNKTKGISIYRKKKVFDGIDGISGLMNKLTVAITRDSIDFMKLDTLLNNELKRKKITIDYVIKHFKNDSVYDKFDTDTTKVFSLSTLSKSTYLPKNQKLELQYTNPTLVILKHSLTGILLSFLLSSCTIICLLYLLRIINKQKELAEMKNDLISNITHEFKTPIATVSTAIEGIKNFNDTNDKEKTNKYLDISDQQLKKLHLMVEKLLETATLDSDRLLINIEETDLVLMLKSLVEKYQMLSPEKNIIFKTNIDKFFKKVDPFHFENAVANLIDNAIKYGGNSIEVNISSLLNSVEMTIADNGGKIDKNQQEKIFGKFYRIPTGNRHDIKGFGIGLFYAKKIIDKHDGLLVLLSETQNTIFKITL